MTHLAQVPADMELVMRVIPMPADSNANGDIFGGWIMAQVDLAGAVLPLRIAKGRIATVAVNQFIFKQPVSIGDLLSFYARVERVGRTSVTVRVEVHAERNPDFAVHYHAFITAHHRHVARVFAAMFEKAGKEPPAAPEALAAAALSFGASLALQSGHGAQRGNPAYAGDMFLLYLRGLLAIAGPARASRPTSRTARTSPKRSPT